MDQRDSRRKLAIAHAATATMRPVKQIDSSPSRITVTSLPRRLRFILHRLPARRARRCPKEYGVTLAVAQMIGSISV